MQILLAGAKNRGLKCLEAIEAAGHTVVGILTNPGSGVSLFKMQADRLSVPFFCPNKINEAFFLAQIQALKPEVIVLAGYSQIVNKHFIHIPSKGCLNLHAGKLPNYRGSSPLNWALIRGEKHFTLSVIQVAQGVDTGDILGEQTFPIHPDDTIATLQAIADTHFPQLLIDTLHQLGSGTLQPKPQETHKAAYYPLRFPEDGLIVWDCYTAEQIHNRIRALADPYPGAFTYYQQEKIKLIASRKTSTPFYGEPGRIYQKKQELLVCALDQCLWVTAYTQTGINLASYVPRYDKLATLRECYFK